MIEVQIWIGWLCFKLLIITFDLNLSRKSVVHSMIAKPIKYYNDTSKPFNKVEYDVLFNSLFIFFSISKLVTLL